MMLGKIRQKISYLFWKLLEKILDGVFFIAITIPYMFLTKEGWRWMAQRVKENAKYVLVGAILTIIIYHLKM